MMILPVLGLEVTVLAVVMTEMKLTLTDDTDIDTGVLKNLAANLDCL